MTTKPTNPIGTKGDAAIVKKQVTGGIVLPNMFTPADMQHLVGRS